MHTSVDANTASQFNKKSQWKIWWKLTRPHTLSASFAPVFIGTALALHYGKINWLLFLAMLLATLIIQAATNMFNEYYDHRSGLDNEHSVGIGGAIVRDGVAPKKVLSTAFTLYGVAILIGIYICISSSWWLAAVGLISMAVGYLYNGGPYPISYTPFGEIFAGLFMGMLIILISFYIQTGYVSLLSVIVATPIAILVGAILLSNSIRDIDEDTEAGRKTLAILLGRKKAINILAGMFIIAYLWVLILMVIHILSPWSLLIIFSLPFPIKAVTGFIGKKTPVQMVPAMKATAQTNQIFGILLAISLFCSYL